MKISIAIPTRERAQYLRSSLATCVAISDPDLEIIVSDNASLDDTRAVVEGFGDGRVRYVNTGKRLSMRQNFEFALAATSGDYVIIIGDDDAMASRQFAMLRAVLERHRPECLSWRSRYYLWPDPRQPDGGGRLKLVRQQSFGAIREYTAAGILEKIATATLSGHDVVPMIYHGAVRRDVIDRLKERTGAVFACGVPDVYFNVAANAVAERVHFIEHPFSIQAISPKSTGFSARFTGERGQDQAIRAFAAEAESDPVVDPIPGRLPAIELYLLNAIEQANRLVYGRALPMAYDVFIARALAGLAKREPEDWQAGTSMIRAFVAELPDSARLVALVDAARPAGWLARKIANVDSAIKRFRRFQPSIVFGGRAVLDIKRLGHGPVDDAVRVLDYCLGPGTAASLEAPASWGGISARARALALRTVFKRGVPSDFAVAGGRACKP